MTRSKVADTIFSEPTSLSSSILIITIVQPKSQDMYRIKEGFNIDHFKKYKDLQPSLQAKRTPWYTGRNDLSKVFVGLDIWDILGLFDQSLDVYLSGLLSSGRSGGGGHVRRGESRWGVRVVVATHLTCNIVSCHYSTSWSCDYDEGQKGMIMRLKIENYLPHSSLSRICTTSPINLNYVQPKQIHIRVSLSGWGCLLWACAKIREMLESIIRLTAKYQNGVAVISQRTFSFVC